MIHTPFSEKKKLILSTVSIYGIPLMVLFLLSFTRDLYGSRALIFLFSLLIVYCLSLFFKKNVEFTNSKIYHIKIGLRKLYKFVFKNELQEHSNISEVEKRSLLFYCVKIFFTPLMIHFIFNNFELMQKFLKQSTTWTLNTANGIEHYLYFIFYLILTIDTFIFAFGYLVEHKKLKNVVRSVESTALGWIVALICYPPFNDLPTKIFGWYSSDFSDFNNIKLNLVFGFISTILFSVYLWATFSLGLKSSNLTNRGIVATGPYKYVRHPAYISKNLSWWVMGLPFILNYGIIAVFSLSIWSFIYYLRALTEERHLMQDSEYVAYMSKVKYKFIPGIF